VSRQSKRGPALGGRRAPTPHASGCACSVADPDPADNGPSPYRLLMNMAEIAEANNVSLSIVRRWVAAGYLKPVDLPLLTRRKLFRRDDVLTFVASCPTAVDNGQPT